MAAFTTLSARVVVLPASNIDTDQIIPARFLKVTDKAGLGDKLFHDWRYRDDGTPDPDFVLARPEAQGARILLAGANFGCGSSREHAPWALVDWGFRAVIAPSFADIFQSNALKNGLLPVALPAEVHAGLLATLTEAAGAGQPAIEVSIDLEAQRVSWPGGAADFVIDAFARRCLLEGMDELEYLLSLSRHIDAHEAQHGADL